MGIESIIKKFKDELDELISEGDLLVRSLIADFIDDEDVRRERKRDLPDFRQNYEAWYSLSLQVIKQVLPDRLSDFKSQYKIEKRKTRNNETYVISDYMIGLDYSDYGFGISSKYIVNKLKLQRGILKSARARLESVLFNMQEILQADMFDNEIDAAKELAKKGYLRGAGAIAGVVLEQHLSHVCSKHGLKMKKKDPSINDFNDLLKKQDIIETPKWRSIQFLADLRNLCGHDKDHEPTKDDVNKLISGVSEVIKTLF